MNETTPKAPTGTKASGRRLWDSVQASYVLEEHEAALLREAVRAVDLLDDLAAIVRRDGMMVEGPAGSRVNPAVIEMRQLSIAFARLLAALRLPAGEPGDQQASARPQRRGAPRGPYSLKGAA